MENFEIYPISPVSKPRQTISDKWKVRPQVAKYRAFADIVRLHKVFIPENYHIIFVLPMPQTWSKRKKEKFCGSPHRQRPDKDNLEKALLDAIHKEDSMIWDGRVTKLWGYSGLIMICEIEKPFDLSHFLSKKV